jgi:hypothetical protein
MPVLLHKEGQTPWLPSRWLIAGLTALSLSAGADQEYQYIVTPPTVVDTSVSADSPASALDLAFANRGEGAMSAAFDSVTRTAAAAGGIALKTTPPRGVILVVH